MYCAKCQVGQLGVMRVCRWRVPPGAGPAGITIEVFEGSNLPADNTEPLLKHTGWYKMQVGNHVGCGQRQDVWHCCTASGNF